MNDEELQKDIEKMTDALYEEPREDTYRSMVSEFYSRRMRSTVILVWANFTVFFALGIFWGFMFFQSGEVKYQIMYAALFICFMQWSTLTKPLAWQRLHKNQIKRELKRLEIQVAELTQAVRAK